LLDNYFSIFFAFFWGDTIGKSILGLF